MRISVMRAMRALIPLMALCSLGVEAQVTDRVNKSSREFVEGFYQWYVPTMLDHGRFRPWNIALKHEHSAFGPRLFELLKENSDAQARCHDLVGLTSIPFLTPR